MAEASSVVAPAHEAQLSVPAPAPVEPPKSPADLAEEAADKKKGRQDIIAGVTLAVFAASLAICDLGAGKYGDDEILINNDKAGAYAWFQSKSMKQTLVEGEAGMLTALLEAGAIETTKVEAVKNHIEHANTRAKKYEKQKTEILLGSAAVGKENWAQDQEGVMGKITGAKEFETKGIGLGKAGDVFDMGTLFLQLCLVMGAIGIVMSSLTQKRIFYGVMCALGLVGTYYTWVAYQAAFLVASGAVGRV